MTKDAIGGVSFSGYLAACRSENRSENSALIQFSVLLCEFCHVTN